MEMKILYAKQLINTSDFSDDLIREVIEFCMPEGVNGVKIVVKSGSGYSHSWPDRKKIEILIPKQGELRFPCVNHPRKRSRWIKVYYSYDGHDYCHSERVEYTSTLRLPTLLLSRTELLVELIAHELRHQWQRRRPLKSQWTYGNRGRTTKTTEEHDCCQYAMMKVRQWRKLHMYDALYLSQYLEREAETPSKITRIKQPNTIIWKEPENCKVGQSWIRIW